MTLTSACRYDILIHRVITVSPLSKHHRFKCIFVVASALFHHIFAQSPSKQDLLRQPSSDWYVRTQEMNVMVDSDKYNNTPTPKIYL